MQGKNRVLLTAAMILIAASLLHAQPPANPFWQRITLGGGGVCFDLEMVAGNETHLEPIWSACGSNGVYRAEWDEDHWNAWTEYLTGKFVYGVDVIVQTDTWTEHVLTASGNYGIHYNSSSSGVFSPAWPRPNYNAPYPTDWASVAVHDVAFYHDATSGPWPQTPEDSIYCILNSTVGAQNPGLYRWRSNPAGFLRFDGETDPIHYDHFHRDLENPNVLYVTSPDGIYKLSGPYGTLPEKLPAGIRLEDLPIARPPLASFKLQVTSFKQ